MQNKNPKKTLLIVLFLGLLVLGGAYAGYRQYVSVRHARLIKQARRYIAKSDTARAQLCLRSALAHNPKDLEACRLMAQLAEDSRLPSALLWRSKVLDLNPHSLEDRLALAQTALVMRDYASATNALEGVDIADKKTAAYHNLAGAVAAAANQPAQAEEHFLEASRLEPQNSTLQLNLAVVRLHETNTLELTEARTALQRLVSNSTNSILRCKALRELTLDAMSHKHEDMGLALSKQLIHETNAAFSDWLLRLEVLLETKNADFKPALAACQRQAATNQGQISELATWEMAKISPGEALVWLRGLPMQTQTNQPTTLLVAECYTSSKDWSGLHAWLEKQHWAELEFLRHAFMSRALRGQHLADAGKAEWDQALQSANNQKQSLVMLLRLAAQWNWAAESEELLWTVVNRYPQEKWATQALTQELFTGGRTRSLMQLFDQEVKRTPTDLTARNNLAMTALLLDAKELKPHDLAREVYQQAPTNSAFATTYAFSLYLQGKNAEALKVVQQLKPQDLDVPTRAGYYGLILKATGDDAKARIYLNWTSKATLLPEERTLFDRAKTGT
jgi:Flp pilus assembly protein TadD